MKITFPSIRAFRSRLNCAFLVGCVLVGAIATKAEAEYTFTFVADSTGPFSGFSPVSLNASGTVAFSAKFDGSGAGVFTGNGGALTTITTAATPPFGNPFNPPSINQAGMVAFAAGDRILAGSGGPLTTIADTAGPLRDFASGYTTSINTAGAVAFTAFLDAGGGGIFVGNGGVVTPVLINSASFGSDNSISLNDAGTLAFRGAKDQRAGIFSFNAGMITTITDISGPFNYFGSAPSLNGAGTVAFAAGVVNGGVGSVSGIYRGNGGPLTTIADLAGPFSYLGDFEVNQPSINAAGNVAFAANLDAGGAGLYIGDGTATSEVLGVGDALFGSTITGFLISPTSLNDSGQVAFVYGLANGTTGIAIANPVPEPSSSLLLALSLGLSLARRTTRKC